MNRKARLGAAAVGAALLLPATAPAQDYYYPIKVTPKLSLKVAPKRDASKPFKFTASGKLNRKSAAASACRGKVTVTAKKGSKKVTKRVSVKSNCTYKAKFTAKVGKAKRGTVKVSARFGGNAALRSAKAVILVSFGPK